MTAARALRSRRAVIALVLAAVVLGGIVWWTTRGSPRAQAVSRLTALGAPVPGLPPAGRPVVTRPSCEAFDYCVSAALTWHAATPYRTFAAVARSVRTWAARNHLGRPVWSCGSHSGLFGSETHSGCEAGFAPGPSSGTAVFVAVTFTDPATPGFDPATVHANSLPPTPHLDGSVVQSVSAQVVEGVHPFG